MREWHTVTVAFAWSRSRAIGFPTIGLRPTTTARAPAVGTRYSASRRITPSGVAPTWPLRPR